MCLGGATISETGGGRGDSESVVMESRGNSTLEARRGGRSGDGWQWHVL